MFVPALLVRGRHGMILVECVKLLWLFLHRQSVFRVFVFTNITIFFGYAISREILFI